MGSQRLDRYSRALGVPVRPYDLRHAFALRYLRGGGDAFSLQRLLGHTGLAMTKRYVDLAEADVTAAHERASPVARLVGTGRPRLPRVTHRG
jgi:site-specific recombinase XerD